jgi:hypothetical protein
MPVPVIALAPWVATAFSWMFREVLVKFLVMAAVYGVMTELLPLVWGWIAPFIGVDNLTVAFAGLTPAMWYGLNWVAFPFGFNLVVSAYIARFFIRRLPFVG